MNILYFINAASSTGGASKSFFTLVKGVVAEGNKVSVVTPRKGPLCDSLRDIGATVYLLPTRPQIYPQINGLGSIFLFLPMLISWKLRNILAFRRLKALFRDAHIDIVHTNISIFSIGYDLAKYLKRPHIFHIREYGDLDFGLHHYPSKQAFLNKLREPYSYNICITHGIQDYNGQKDNPASRVIYNGIIHPDLSQLPKQPSRNYFLYAGRIEPAKGVIDLINAYHLYVQQTDSPYPLWLAGSVASDSYRQEVEKVVATWQLSEHVVFLGNRTDMVPLMGNARAVIVPSFNEGFGRCMPEAMLCNTVVIARNTGGSKEQMDNGRRMTGEEIALPFLSNEELANQLFSVATTSPDAFDDMRERAQSVVEQLYSPEHHVTEVLSFYHQILTSHEKHR